MKIFAVCALFFILTVTGGMAQTGKFTDPVGEADAKSIGAEEAKLDLKQVTISDCEEAGFWETKMAQDEGMITIKTMRNNPETGGAKEKITKDAQRIADEREIRKDPNWLGEYVLGVKVSFYKRGANVFSIHPVKPIPIPGTTKILSVWVVGRNYRHELKVIIADFFGNRAELSLGTLNFSGWRKLSVAVPPKIAQSDLHFSNIEGLKFLGLKVLCNPDEAFGTYYIYFDDVSADTDLFSMKSRDEDDMDDGW